MSEIHIEHLVKYPLPPHRTGGEPRTAYINTIQMTGVYWSKGWRSYKDTAVNRRLVKLWQKKHPILSRYWTPFKLWHDGWRYTYWNEPSVVICYGDVKHIFYMPSNDIAERVIRQIKDTFWKENV